MNPFLVDKLALVCSRTYPTSTHITDHVLVAKVYSIQCLIVVWQPCREACTESHSLGDKEDDTRYVLRLRQDTYLMVMTTWVSGT